MSGVRAVVPSRAPLSNTQQGQGAWEQGPWPSLGNLGLGQEGTESE